MARYSLLVKKTMNETKNAVNAQTDLNVVDAGIINTLWTKSDIEGARKLIQNPYIIYNLIQNNPINNAHELKCFYAMHALLLMLIDDECTDILNQMSEDSINMLKQCLTIAKKHPHPNIKDIEKVLKERSAAKYVKNAYDRWINENMIKSLNVSKNVHYLWDKANTELQKWFDIVAVFKRADIEKVSETTETTDTAQKPIVSIQNVELWTIDELAKKLGHKSKHSFEVKKCELIKRNPNRADEIQGWFVRSTTKRSPLLFQAIYFKELQDLFARKNKTTKKLTSKNRPTLVDMKAFETYIESLQTLCKQTIDALEIADKDYKKSIQAATSAKPHERGKLLQDAITANDNATKYRATLDDYKACLDNATQLLQERQRTIAALAEIDKKMSETLHEFNQNQK